MAKKQSTKRRTQVKDLPKKGKKLSAGDMKRVKGGFTTNITNEVVSKRPKGGVVTDNIDPD